MVQVPITAKSFWFYAEGTGKSVYKIKGVRELVFIIYPSSKGSLFNTEILHASSV